MLKGMFKTNEIFTPNVNVVVCKVECSNVWEKAERVADF
jgi:hypothetical protein